MIASVGAISRKCKMPPGVLPDGKTTGVSFISRWVGATKKQPPGPEPRARNSGAAAFIRLPAFSHRIRCLLGKSAACSQFGSGDQNTADTLHTAAPSSGDVSSWACVRDRSDSKPADSSVCASQSRELQEIELGDAADCHQSESATGGRFQCNPTRDKGRKTLF